MAVTLTNLTDEIDRKLGNVARKGSTLLVGNAVQTVFSLGGAPLVGSSVTVSGSPTIDYENGILTYSSAPAATSFLATYQYQYWSLAQVQEAINNAIAELYDRFYVKASELITTTGSNSYSCGSTVALDDQVYKVEYNYATNAWIVLTDWRSHRETASSRITIEMGQPPPTGKSLRVSYAKRPTPFPCTTPASETLETTVGLPAFAREVIVLYACASLLDARIARRNREDRGHDTQVDDTVSTDDLIKSAQEFRSNGDARAEALRMPAPSELDSRTKAPAKAQQEQGAAQ